MPKKQILCAITAFTLLLGVTACKGDNRSTRTSSSYHDYESEQPAHHGKSITDSMTIALGHYGGAITNQIYYNMLDGKSEDSKKKFTKECVINGIVNAIGDDEATTEKYEGEAKEAYNIGLQIGLKISNIIEDIYSTYDIQISKSRLMKAFKETFNKDQITDVDKYAKEYQEVNIKFQNYLQELESDNIKQSPENVNNISEGKVYINKMVKDNGFTLAKSGIAYKIFNPGAPRKIQPTDRIAIRYQGRKIDGTVFDETQGEPYESSANVFIPGFNEALYMLGNGGKMTVIIPSDQAYGETGAGDIINPGETLVFDIEIVSATPK